jgi:hypothetical protein
VRETKHGELNRRTEQNIIEGKERVRVKEWMIVGGGEGGREGKRK